MKRFALALSVIVVGVVVSSCAVGLRGTATDITDTSAVLDGAVLSTTGGPGSWYIEYGPTTARTERTPTRNIEFVVNESQPVSEPVDGLEPGTIYHYRVCAEDSENPGDPFCSPDQTFETDFDPATTDAVTGTASFENGVNGHPFTVTHEYRVFSGPAGENPSGTVVARTPGAVYEGEVACVHVTGNRAVIGLAPGPIGDIYLVVTDGGTGGQDTFGAAGASGSATECDAFTGEVTATPYTGGDIIVHDAPASPSS